MGHPLLELKQRTAVVVGGTSGIGLALSKALAQAGANVVPTGRRTELVRSAASAVEKLGGRSLVATCDVLAMSTSSKVAAIHNFRRSLSVWRQA